MQKLSILQHHWQQKEFDWRFSKAISQRFELSEVLSDLLAMRKIEIDEIENFLRPKIKTALPNPFDLGSVADGVSHVISALKQKQKITIFADYDVDGATSAALFKRFFVAIGVEVSIYVPDRILEGYGPNREALLKIKNSGSDLVIMVDCGTVAFEPLLAAKEAGLDIIVIDHHLGVLQKPEAIAVINPNLLDEKFPHKNLCAAGVSFLFLVALNKKLRDCGFYNPPLEGGSKLQASRGGKITEPNLLNFLDLVALGTVCDVMTLKGLNRAFVDAGLKILNQRKNLGLRTICDLAGLNEKPSAYHLGFIIGPRINAGGRIGKSDLGARILSSENEMEVQQIARELEVLNSQRKNIEVAALEEAIAALEKGENGFSKNDAVIFAMSENWHQGVIGIVASRLKDLYGKPVAVIALDKENNKGKASCRSISGVDFGLEILNARSQNLLLEGGGHAMAGGFSVERNKIKDLHKFFCEKLNQKVAEILAQNISQFDISLDLVQVNLDLIKELSQLEPFGMGNVRPKFLLKDVVKVRANLVGATGDHVSCIFSSKSTIGFSGNIQAIAFRAAKTPVGEILLDDKIKNMNLIGTLDINNYMGIEKVQMIIEDIIC